MLRIFKQVCNTKKKLELLKIQWTNTWNEIKATAMHSYEILSLILKNAEN